VISLPKWIISSLLSLSLVFSACQFTPTLQPQQPQRSQKPPQPTKVVHLAAVGDIMMHSPQIRAGQLTKGGYDFRPFFKEIKPYIDSADLAIGNLETTLAGKSYPYSGYPRFNAPDEIVDALKYAGIDLVSTSNNHALDTGEKGVIRTYQTLQAKGVQPVGTSPSAPQRHATLVQKNGIQFAFLAYTQHTNGLPVPTNKPYLVNMMNTQQIAHDIQTVRQQGVDFICVSLHFGEEYQQEPNEFQRKIARQVLADGADVILGSHPHVLQPIEKVLVAGKEKWIIYSLGNFISNQHNSYTDEGAIVYLDVVKDVEKGQTNLKEVSFLPTYVHKYRLHGKAQYVVIPMEKKAPVSLDRYPGMSTVKWEATWSHIYTTLTKQGEVATFTEMKSR
jgi:poly-gamma-glutamate capsule biosynthesis protein CapA/YwtB (metallophosphatase superfamily)